MSAFEVMPCGSCFHSALHLASGPLAAEPGRWLWHRAQAPNQSLERTRWARAVRFAVRHWWRAAQLQIRYTSG